MKKLEIFKSNPNLKEVFMTSDGEAFYNENDAKLHAKSLEDKSVELVKNPSQIEVIAEDVDKDAAELEAFEKAEAEKAKAVQEASEQEASEKAEAEVKAKAEQEAQNKAKK